jgi:hypothetical protein
VRLENGCGLEESAGEIRPHRALVDDNG